MLTEQQLTPKEKTISLEEMRDTLKKSIEKHKADRELLNAEIKKTEAILKVLNKQIG